MILELWDRDKKGGMRKVFAMPIRPGTNYTHAFGYVVRIRAVVVITDEEAARQMDHGHDGFPIMPTPEGP